VTTSVAAGKTRKETVGCTPWLIEQSKTKGAKYKGGNKAMAYMHRQQGAKESAGWLRRLEARLSGRKTRKTPNDDEKNLALKLYLTVQSCDAAAKVVAWAWGVGRFTIYNWKKKAEESATMTVARKTRKDAGQTVFTSDSRRAATYTEGKLGPQRLFASRAKEGESISHAQAAEAYRETPPDFKAETAAIAAHFKERARFLQSELKRVLIQTNGCISWAALERSLNGDEGAKIISASTIS
jgi:hypothetical protein